MRDIRFKGKTVKHQEWIYGSLIIRNSGVFIGGYEITAATWEHPCGDTIWIEEEVEPETVGQFTGIENWKEVKVWEGDVIEFWLCYATSQTHTGDNIPTGSYTEPDECQIVKIKARVFYDEEEGKFDWSLVGPYPYAFSEYVEDYCFRWKPRILIGLSSYDRSYIKSLLSCPDEYTAEEFKEYSDLLFELTGMSEDDFMKVCNDFEVVGNIHDNPEFKQ